LGTPNIPSHRLSSVDTSTAVGEIVANVMASIAQWERRIIAERTFAAM
jgi:DNA invertase Pin-like site-specific DNA recombinase